MAGASRDQVPSIPAVSMGPSLGPSSLTVAGSHRPPGSTPHKTTSKMRQLRRTCHLSLSVPFSHVHVSSMKKLVNG